MKNKILLALLVLQNIAMAKGGLEKVQEVANTFQVGLAAAAITIVTIAFMWVGFKMIFRGARFEDVALVAIGGIVIGGAAGFASLFVG